MASLLLHPALPLGRRGEGNFTRSPKPLEGVTTIAPVLFHVIPAKAGIQCFRGTDWTPVFTGETAEIQFFHTLLY